MLGGNGFEIAQKNGEWFRYFLLGVLSLSLWFFRFGIHGWDNGIFLDDWDIYGMHYVFDAIPSFQSMFSKFHRPLGFLLLFNLSPLWANFQIVHLISSILHGINAILVFLIARRLLLGTEASFVSCLFFLLFPIPSEAVYWASCIHNVLGVTLGCASILLAFRYGAKGFVFKLVLTVMAFLSSALYEQGALLFCVSIGICLIQEIQEKGWKIKRLSLCFLPLIGLGVYFILFRITTASFSGDRFSLNPLHLVSSKYLWTLITYLRISILGEVARKFFWNGFWSGINVIGSNWWVCFLFIGNLCLAAGVTWAWAMKTEKISSAKLGLAFGVSLGIILITLSIFSINRESSFPFRVTYAPSVGLSLFVGFFVAGAFQFLKDKKWFPWFYSALVLLIVLIFIPVNYSELTQYRRQRDLDIHQAREIQSYFSKIKEGSFFWLLNIPWITQEVTVLHAEHIINIWAAGDWGTPSILSCMYKKRIDGKPLHSGKKISPHDFPRSWSNTYVLWFDKGSFFPVYEIVLLGTLGETRKYRFPLMEHLDDSWQKRMITLEAADRLDQYPNYETGR